MTWDELITELGKIPAKDRGQFANIQTADAQANYFDQLLRIKSSGHWVLLLIDGAELRSRR